MMTEPLLLTEHLLSQIGIFVGVWSTALTIAVLAFDVSSASAAMRRSLQSFIAMLADLRQMRG